MRKGGSTLSEAAVTPYCSERLAAFKVPKGVVFIERLPKNPSCKLLKRELRQQLGSSFTA